MLVIVVVPVDLPSVALKFVKHTCKQTINCALKQMAKCGPGKNFQMRTNFCQVHFLHLL